MCSIKICFRLIVGITESVISYLKGFIKSLIALCFFLTACDNNFPGDCFKSTGDHIWEERELESFNNVRLQDNIDLFLYPDTFNYVKIYAGANLIENITTTINDSVLKIKNQNSCNWVRDPGKPIEAHVHIKSLDTLEYYSGYGNIETITPIEGSSFNLKVKNGHGDVRIKANTHHAFLSFKSGTSDIHYEGNVNYLGIFYRAFGRFDSRKMNASHTYINQMSSNDAYIKVEKRLVVEIHLQGNVYYLGSPEIEIQGIYGEGDLIPLE